MADRQGWERTPVISLGAGVQSSTLLLMAADGEFGAVPPLAIFADTGWEPRAVYNHLDWLDREVAGRVEIVRVAKGNIRDDVVRAAAGEGGRFAPMPLYVTNRRGEEGALRRQCTREYKLEPIYRELRARGYGPARPVEMWLGISLDEVQRMKPARVRWAENRWPLIERRMTRGGCITWLSERRLAIPPKSACVGCPFHGDAQWRALRDEHPDEWAEAVALDKAIRVLPRIDGEAFLHRQRVPLDEVDLSTPSDRGQLDFDAECEGMCGV